MKLLQLFRQIESVEFEVIFTVIENPRVFMRALEENDTLAALIANMQKRPAGKVKVLNRLLSLASTQSDIQYQHQHDIALTAYLFVLSVVDYPMAYITATLLKLLPNVWWAGRLANKIIESMETAEARVEVSESASKTVTFSPSSSSARVLATIAIHKSTDIHAKIALARAS